MRNETSWCMRIFEAFNIPPPMSIKAARAIECFEDAAEVTVKLSDRTNERRQQATDVWRGDRWRKAGRR